MEKTRWLGLSVEPVVVLWERTVGCVFFLDSGPQNEPTNLSK